MSKSYTKRIELQDGKYRILCYYNSKSHCSCEENEADVVHSYLYDKDGNLLRSSTGFKKSYFTSED